MNIEEDRPARVIFTDLINAHYPAFVDAIDTFEVKLVKVNEDGSSIMMRTGAEVRRALTKNYGIVPEFHLCRPNENSATW